MRLDTSIQELSKIDTSVLIAEFEERSAKELTSIIELVEIFSIYIALTFKNIEEVNDFFESGKTISYEWFAKIAEIFLLEHKSQSILTTIPNILLQNGDFKNMGINIIQI